MSKIKVDTIQSSNENVELAPNGSGLVEVKGAGGADGTLKLVSANGTNSVKIKSPPHSASQSQTIILPDNNITQNDFLKVKSVSGSSPDKVAQLEYEGIAEPDLTNLNANNLTSGTVPAARFPAALAGTSTALKLIQKAEITSGNQLASITFSLDEGTYYLLCKHLSHANYSHIEFGPKDSSGSAIYSKYLNIYGNSPNITTTNSNTPSLYTKSGSNTNMSNQFDMYIFNSSDEFAVTQSGWSANLQYSRTESYIQNSSGNSGRMYSFTLTPSNGSFYPQTQILLYKFLES
tara:strand:+ start:2961 stop:3833 length:873 start_codon:yes stop_codon:yes gene_type:complete